jgi:hypothetical protein
MLHLLQVFWVIFDLYAKFWFFGYTPTSRVFYMRKIIKKIASALSNIINVFVLITMTQKWNFYGQKICSKFWKIWQKGYYAGKNLKIGQF